MIQELINDLVKKIEAQKEEILISKLIAKGYSHYINHSNQRFPKVACIIRECWTCYYADNGTQNGEFIVGYKNPEINFEDGCKYTMTANVITTDNDPFG